MAQPLPIVLANHSGDLWLFTSPTITTKVGQPTPVCFTDRNGNEYAVSGVTISSYDAEPIPVVLCNSIGDALNPPFVLTSNGSIISIGLTSGSPASNLSGNRLGNPTPIVLTDPNGIPTSVSGFTLGNLTEAPTSAVITDKNGNLVTLTLAV